jgi:hypothetical protein
VELPCARRANSSIGGCVYNFVLEHSHVLLVNGMECATWGHGMSGPVIGHDFWGSAAAIERCLSALPGWNRGLVHVSGVVRNSQGLVVSMRGAN